MYATAALREFIGRAAVQNRAPPPELRGYTARVETELGLILRDSLGREIVGQVEQLAARAMWDRSGSYEMHVIGFRSLTAGAPYSALSWTRMYTVPTLYGNRLVIGMNDGIARTRSDSNYARRRATEDSAAGRDRFRSVHPLAVDRDKYYQFTGGDTVATLYASGRRIRLMRVHVSPVARATSNFGAYEGELDFDADRHQLVRMRGRFVNVSNERGSLVGRGMGAVAVAYVEFENAEVNGKYWLPVFQRSEFQAQLAMFGPVRPIYRIVSRFREHVLREDTLVTIAQMDTLPLPRTSAKLTFASKDSVSRFGEWTENLGVASRAVGSDDFDDLAPDVWKNTGPPRVDPYPRQFEDMVRFNRIEGLFTGVSGALLFRDMAPGLVLRATGGWAWSEGTARGSLAISRTGREWIPSARIARDLATTNDFLEPLETGLSIGPLISGEDIHDYVDRRSAAAGVSRVIGGVDRAMLSLEGAYVDDAVAYRNVVRPVFGGISFRPNRGIIPGRYARGTATLEWRPSVATGSLSSGFGGRIFYQVGSGELDYQKLEVRVAARKYWRGVVFASQVDAGAVKGSVIPPQQIYEMGGVADLTAYNYKAYGGDHAALGRALAAYHFPVLRTPRRVWRLMIPGLSPGVGGGVRGGWTEISSPEARQALLGLGGDGVTPLSVATDRIRATADIRFTILSGAIGAGFTRPIDRAGRWRPFFGMGAAF